MFYTKLYVLYTHLKVFTPICKYADLFKGIFISYLQVFIAIYMYLHNDFGTCLLIYQSYPKFQVILGSFTINYPWKSDEFSFFGPNIQIIVGNNLKNSPVFSQVIIWKTIEYAWNIYYVFMVV